MAFGTSQSGVLVYFVLGTSGDLQAPKGGLGNLESHAGLEPQISCFPTITERQVGMLSLADDRKRTIGLLQHLGMQALDSRVVNADRVGSEAADGEAVLQEHLSVRSVVADL
ncbi:MAG TPA: hypothetical protein VHP11_12280 [Tepidisphaeraceae bacterium]|nr:hypothetical protein [Tepidisphaeraceae bacterium]